MSSRWRLTQMHRFRQQEDDQWAVPQSSTEATRWPGKQAVKALISLSTAECELIEAVAASQLQLRDKHADR